MDSSKKQYKRGKFLSYISFGSILLAVAACLCFLPIPNANPIIKCIICAVGYVAWDAAYTIVNVQSLNPNGKTDIYYKVHAR